MISIFATTDKLNEVKQVINAVNRLSELVEVYPLNEKPSSDENVSLIVNEKISLMIDWTNARPPYLFSSNIKFQKDTLLGIVFNILGNDKESWDFLANYPEIQFEVSLSNKLKYGHLIDLQEISNNSSNHHDLYTTNHNSGVVRHYGHLSQNIAYSQIEKYYEKAIHAAPNAENKAFTSYHLASLLLDVNQLSKAEKIIEKSVEENITDDARYALMFVLVKVWMKQLSVPYDQKLIEKLKTKIWDVLQYLESKNRKPEIGMILLDASHVANISKSFSEALGYIKRAITIFMEEELEALLGSAFIAEGRLLYTWAQNGNPQFFKPATKSYQEALKIFTKEAAPSVFADIHHDLANIYVDMPIDDKKKSLWGGVAASSFNEALNYYTKEKFPYEYGMICNNYGNAFTKFPKAQLVDNNEKALYYYKEALDVRTSDFPLERTLTLLNYLEASWNVGNSPDEFNKERYEDMKLKAEEILKLTKDDTLLAKAKKHIKLLDELFALKDNQ